MTLIAFVPGPEAAESLVAWMETVGEQEPLDPQGAPDPQEPQREFLCWEPGLEDRTSEAVRAALGERAGTVTPVRDADPIAHVAEHCLRVKASLLVSTGFELRGVAGSHTSRALVDAAPCRVFLVLYGDRHPGDIRKVLLYLDGTADDIALVEVSTALERREGIQYTPATIEPDIGEGAEEVGRRELEEALHDAGAVSMKGLEPRVMVDNHPIRGMLRLAQDQDFVIVGASSYHLVEHLQSSLPSTTVAVVKRKPPLRRRAVPDWIPRINPEDYAELVQDLRAGSRWRANFWVMLAMAAAIASLGLLQNSPAVVIGSMLLAPLMTPMIGFGLALVQANPGLARLCITSVGFGVLLTLFVSFVIGWITPSGVTLSPEILARGSPNVLDLGIAFFAAIAAAFALARPGISGAVAGVAIATALVPPLCSAGIALAYGDMKNALGATLLFSTNFLAIVLGASITFTALGISADRALPLYRRGARHVIFGIVAALLVLSVPLGISLSTRIQEGREQPLAYPVTRKVMNALTDRIDAEEGVELMLVARPAKTRGVLIHLAADRELARSLGGDLERIVRREMADEELPVRVIPVRRAWGD